MNDIKILNTKLSENYSLPYLKNFLNKGEMEFSIENMLKRKELDKNKNFNKTKITKFTQLINKLSDNIIYTNKSLLNLLNKNEYNLNISKSANLNKEFSHTKINKNESKLIFMNEQQYIRLIKQFNSKLLILHYYKLENLVKLLSKLFNKSVELELIRIYSPQNESNILANLIGVLSNFIKFRNIHMKLFKVSKTKKFKKRFSNNKIPSFLSGIYLKLAGRVLTQKIQRRVKSKVIQKGSLARANTELINTKTFVNKNKRGVFSITIKTGHIINN